MVEKAVSLGMTGSAIVDSLREAGLGYRTQDIYADVRRVSGRRLYEEPISRLLPTSFVPVHMVEELPYNMTTNYWYRVRATYLDPSTGQETERHFIHGTDDWLSKQQVTEELEADVPISGYEAAMMLTSLDVIGVSHKSGAAYSR